MIGNRASAIRSKNLFFDGLCSLAPGSEKRLFKLHMFTHCVDPEQRVLIRR